MIQLINSVALQKFSKRGLSINEGIAIDARLVKSASKPLSNDELKKQREEKSNCGNLYKNGKLIKFIRDLESNWTIKNDKPHYGLKEHASVDVDNGFILATTLTPASEHDSKYLPYLALASCHTQEPIKEIYADKGYFREPNREFLHLNNIKVRICASAPGSSIRVRKNSIIFILFYNPNRLEYINYTRSNLQFLKLHLLP